MRPPLQPREVEEVLAKADCARNERACLAKIASQGKASRPSSRLGDQDQSGENVPRINPQLDKPVQSSIGYMGERQRRRTIPPILAAPTKNGSDLSKVGGGRRLRRILERNGGGGEGHGVADMDRNPVTARSLSDGGSVQLVRARMVDDADRGHPGVDEPDRNAPIVAFLHEVGGAVD
jgi:hypothetical protein